MKAPKNLEGIFVAAAFFSTFAAYATADVPVVEVAAPSAYVGVVQEAPVQTVEVKAKRLTAAEKAAL
jgi:hypothetical protein